MNKTRDFLAEMYVAGVLADSGWNVYFPHRDEGFDFIITKSVGSEIIVRPVQVKGKYPELTKTNKSVYGYRGRLTQIHPEMVLAIPFFPIDRSAKSPEAIAFMPLSMVKKTKRGYRCDPAQFIDSKISIRRDYRKFFDGKGIELLEKKNWKNTHL